MSDTFRVPAGTGESELTEKRSRFLGHLRKVETEEDAKMFISTIKKQFHDARHNCWCYRIHDVTERFSDDGEPSGSAGMPMLEVFRREDVFNFVCVVTRYFGGVLLGTGGLSRAYSSAAKLALTDAGILLLGRQRKLSVQCPYAFAERLKSFLMSAGAEITDQTYGTYVALTLLVPEAKAEELSVQITDLSNGKAQTVIGESVYESTGDAGKP